MEKVTLHRINNDHSKIEAIGTDGDFDLATSLEIELYQDFIQQVADGTLSIIETKKCAQQLTKTFHLDKRNTDKL